MLFVLLGAGVIIIVVLMLSDFGRKLESKTDAQLYSRYERWTNHAMKFDFWDERRTKIYDEVRRTEQELERRGYDMTKLEREAIDAKLFRRPIDFSLCRTSALGDKMLAMANAMSKLKANVDMFISGIAPERLGRDSDRADLEYYIGYITAISRCIAETDGVAPDGVMLTIVQVETSRLFGNSDTKDSDYAEGIELLPTILTTRGAGEGCRDGEIDGRYVCNPQNPGPYFGKLRARFDVRLPGQPT